MTTLALAQTLACCQVQCTVTQNEPKKKKKLVVKNTNIQIIYK